MPNEPEVTVTTFVEPHDEALNEVAEILQRIVHDVPRATLLIHYSMARSLGRIEYALRGKVER